MSKRKTRISKKAMAKVKASAPKRAHKPYKVYEHHHTQEMEMLNKRMPGAIDVVEQAKEKMDKAIRNAKRTASYKRMRKWEKEATVLSQQQMEEYRKERIWVPKRVLRQKELERRAAYFEKDRKGKTRLQSGLDKIVRMAELADRWSGGGYVTYAQIEFMADKLGIDMNEMLEYDLLQMSNAIHEVYETGMDKDEREEFGYVEVGRSK